MLLVLCNKTKTIKREVRIRQKKSAKKEMDVKKFLEIRKNLKDWQKRLNEVTEKLESYKKMYKNKTNSIKTLANILYRYI